MTKNRTLTIPHHELENGIIWILQNASEFVVDACLSLNQRRTTHVAGFLALAIQELGKAELLRLEFQNLLRQIMEEAQDGKVVSHKYAEIKDFYDHRVKHDLGIELLPEDVRKIIQWKLRPFSEKGVEEEYFSIDEEFRLLDFYVDYKNGWGFPRPGYGIGGVEPPDIEITMLIDLADAIDRVVKEFRVREI